MRAFVTGGTGFIGKRVVQKLLKDGHEVFALARSERSAAVLVGMGAQVVPGDITDTESMRGGMIGCDLVIHLAAWYKLGAMDASQAEAINVGGTRKVLRLAHELGVPKIVYVSTIAVFGDTKGQLVDETYFQGGPFLTDYDRTKWLAHYKVAVPLIEKGAPIVIVMPGGVYGPEDTSIIAEMIRLFYRGLPAMPGPELTLTYAHVGDVANGILLAAKRGKIGESYILTGPAIPLGEMVDFWGHLTGKTPPAMRIPSAMLRPFSPLMGLINKLVPLSPAFSQEAVASLGSTYIARSDKAREELGWQTRPLQTGMLETFAWIAETEAARPPLSREKKWAGLALIAAAVLFFYWLLGNRKEK